MMRRPTLLLPALLLLAGCPGPTPGTGLPDACNTPEQALAAPCLVTLGGSLTGHLSFSGDEDWYGVRVPAQVTARTLVQVRAGYTGETPVQLGVRLEEAQAGTVLSQATDAHGGTRAARPVTQHVRATAAGAGLRLRLADVPAAGGAPASDTTHAYEVSASLVEDPDTHEPNDTEPTPLSLDTSGDTQVAHVQGALSVSGDVDRYSLAAPAGHILWARLSAPTAETSPLALTLLGPGGDVLATASQTDGAGEAVVTLSATRLTTAGTYQLLARREAPAGSAERADPGQAYALEVRLLDEADASEGTTDNDAPARAREASLEAGIGASASFTGRLSAAGDEDWYAVRLPAFGQPSLLRYRLVPLATGGRIPAPAGPGQRRVQVFTQVVVGSDVAARQQACLTQEPICPRGSPLSAAAEAMRTEACQREDAVLCLQAARFEAVEPPALGNFTGTLSVPSAAGARLSFFRVEADGTWADDQDYRLDVRWEEDADDAARHEETGEAPPALSLATAPADDTFPAPPAETSSTLSGLLTYGSGSAGAVRGPQDYEARSDVDTFVFVLPSVLEEPLDRTLAVQWEVERLADGGVPGALELALTFCDGDATGGGACTPVSTGADGTPLRFVHRDAPAPAWHTPAGAPAEALQPLTAQTLLPGAAQVTVQPYACSCIEPRFVRGGTLEVRVRAEARDDWAPVHYTVRLAQMGYPKAYAVDGGTVSCPAPEPLVAPDGGTGYAPGCRFAGK